MLTSLPLPAVVAALPPADPLDLVCAARSGDAVALGALYDRYAAMLYRTAFRLVGNSDDAQDIVHDCFVGLPEALRHYDERGTLEAWLRRIVVRLVLMRRRSETRRKEAPIDEAAVHDSGHRTDAGADADELWRAVQALPDSLRDVFILKQVEGYSHEEIARMAGISVGASRVRLTRALEALRRALFHP